MELSKVRTIEQIVASFKDGQIIAIGGQTNHYMPERLIDCALESGARHLTVYSIDSSDPGMTPAWASAASLRPAGWTG